MLYGGMPTEDRERIKAAFQAAPGASPVRILLATDAASEGVDLQNHCHRLIHYEIPWNPNRMEQRNGRIDRHEPAARTPSRRRDARAAHWAHGEQSGMGEQGLGVEVGREDVRGVLRGQGVYPRWAPVLGEPAAKGRGAGRP